MTFRICGTQLFDANGNPFVIRGINHAHTWFKDGSPLALRAIASTGANLVRIVLSNGQQWTKDSVEEVTTLLSQCEELQLIAMLEIHDAIGKDNIDALQHAVAYWIELKSILIGKEDRVIINIANEWFGSWSSYAWSVGYEFAVTELRNAGLTHLLVIDTAGYGQYPQAILDYGKALFQHDPLARLMFSVHMYEDVAADESAMKQTVDDILTLNLPLVIGEFGNRASTTRPVDVVSIMRYAEEKKVGWVAWSWYGNSGSDAVLDLCSGPDRFILTPWGTAVVKGCHGLQHTSSLCSIFYKN